MQVDTTKCTGDCVLKRLVYYQGSVQVWHMPLPLIVMPFSNLSYGDSTSKFSEHIVIGFFFFWHHCNKKYLANIRFCSESPHLTFSPFSTIISCSNSFFPLGEEATEGVHTLPKGPRGVTDRCQKVKLANIFVFECKSTFEWKIDEKGARLKTSRVLRRYNRVDGLI